VAGRATHPAAPTFEGDVFTRTEIKVRELEPLPDGGPRYTHGVFVSAQAEAGTMSRGFPVLDWRLNRSEAVSEPGGILSGLTVVRGLGLVLSPAALWMTPWAATRRRWRSVFSIRSWRPLIMARLGHLPHGERLVLGGP